MPEGDTIHRIAAQLAPRITGRVLRRVTTQGLVRDVDGRTVTSVAAHGKHLVIDLDDGTYLRAHLGMNGRFRAYDRAAGDAMLAKLSPGRASLALTTDDHVFLWINAPTIEISRRRSPLHRSAVATLGPDVLATDFDPALAATRAAAHGERRIGELLLDQRVVAGIGNIWKSESLFAAGVAPRTPVRALDPATLAAIYAAAHRLMSQSLAANAPRGREQVSRDLGFAVYSRTGRPCPRCATAIVCEQLGDPPRWTWWCPTCQPPLPDPH